ncbi:MAG: hypothetical protein HY830_19615 [Actinobacteria bacterium]|nr:hypothetical protein [Actinomycetota bacterium]
MTPVPTPTLVIPARFSGPPGSGNGGWVAGALAAHVPGALAGRAVAVRLSAPPPLETVLDVVPLDGADPGSGVRLLHGEVVAATAAPADLPPAGFPDPDDAPDTFVPVDVARAAAAGYPGPGEHPFPTCFTCSPDHPTGLRLTPARPAGGAPGTTATPWLPDASSDAGDGRTDLATVWAALDCPGIWTLDLAGRVFLLGTMTAAVARRPGVGEQCVVAGTVRAERARTTLTTTTLFTADGEPLARTAQVWVEVDPARIAPAG